LRGFEIRLPPLRERKDDIAVLAEHFLHGTGKSLTPDAVSALRQCAWPGNVRQLRTVLACAATRTQESATIDADRLDLDIPGGPGSVGAPQSTLGQLPPTPPTSGSLLRALEADAILSALETHKGNRTRAARALGIHRSTLLRRLQTLELEPTKGTLRCAKPGGDST
jgi:DNA-binding NtrC family response regulator